ncbi:hypothetical protein RHSIM_Rhsim08G0044800 [Rhododendron simsii]|uniref:Uncharacterized protein n=1 Tax=Rhododendron simsii TaxID=118357 RepID=A0A834LJ05_RHOSS|nr:hypothetical protein RHSIM_Rhsim08G0044800 [Rhododendron simsii]
MQTFPAIRPSDLSSLPGAGAAFFIPRTQLTFPNKLFFCRAKYAESGNAGSHNLIFAPANPLVTEKEEAKAVLTLFLKKRGLSNAVAARTVNKSALFIDHLVSTLHSVHKNRP